jgi:carbohydrate kinase (thermoresistant glucokinase family)
MATTETKGSEGKTASGLVVVICGVSGSGKSTIAADLAKALNGAEFADADSFHSKENKEKMASGTPLTDEDRQPWLEALQAWAASQRKKQQTAVLACSALKRKYRSIIRGGEQPRPDVAFVLLSGSKELIASRMAERKHEFMSSKLLDVSWLRCARRAHDRFFIPVSQSQFQTLELPDAKEGVLIVSIEPSPAEIVANIAKLLQEQGLQPKASAGGAPSLRDRFVGSLLGGVIGDALGAAFEGYPWQMILQAKPDLTVYSAGASACFSRGVQLLASLWRAAPHMGIRELGPRKGMFTDDSNSTLALLDSLVEHKHLHPVRVARNYGCFWRSDPQRGYPDSAQEVMRQVGTGIVLVS